MTGPPPPEEDDAASPILPAHIEQTLAQIARLHADHRSGTGLLQRVIDRMTAVAGRPRFVAILTLATAAWIGGNLLALARFGAAWDPPPFAWLQNAVSLLALYITVLILTTQRHENRLADYREQLTLELAILAEQKAAKIIALLEEMRRDSTTLHDREDPEAAAMSVAAEPQAVLDAIKGTEDLAPPGTQPQP